MEVNVLSEHGYFPAMLGLSLSYNQDVGKMPEVADKLKNKYGGHNKFLESIFMWVDVDAPLYFWKQGDTYRLSTKQSESTMHTLLRTPITQELFEDPIDDSILDKLEEMRVAKDFDKLNSHLPQSFLQRRIWVMNYMVIKNIIRQRRGHKLPQWDFFIDAIFNQAENKELLT